MNIVLDSPHNDMSQYWKRKKDDDDEDVEEPDYKRTKYSWYVTLESESPIPTDEDAESTYTLQGNETEYARDTSDTASEIWEEGSVTDAEAFIEYELATDNENDAGVVSDVTSSEPEDYVTVGVIAAICETDVGWADGSDDSRSSIDSEISRADFWSCIQCNNDNNNPLFRYCEKCYQVRKALFPRPTRMKKKKRALDSNKAGTSSKSEESSQELLAMDSGLGSSQERTDDLKSQHSDISSTISSGTDTPTECFESGVGSNDGVDVVDGPLPNTSNPDVQSTLPLNHHQMLNIENKPKMDDDSRETLNSDKMCVICTMHPKDGVFVHGNTSHISCCYNCTVKVWKTNNKHCPICNRKVTQVLKAYFA